MNQKDLQTFKKQLVEEKSLLIKGITAQRGAAAKPREPEGGDVCDIASNDRERDLWLRLNERERGKLRQIEEALERIEDGSFGLCERCDAKIPLGRLKVMPFATVCVACKSQIERHRKAHQGMIIEGPLSRDVGAGDFAREDED